MSAEQPLSQPTAHRNGAHGPDLRAGIAAAAGSAPERYILTVESIGESGLMAAFPLSRPAMRALAIDILATIGEPDAAPPPHRDLSNSEIAERIVIARRRRGLTQDQLAEQVGVSRSAVSQWETGRSGQARRNLSAVAAALDVDVITLLQQ